MVEDTLNTADDTERRPMQTADGWRLKCVNYSMPIVDPTASARSYVSRLVLGLQTGSRSPDWF